jgi:tetratricopeptide (TPR) repeat protein
VRVTWDLKTWVIAGILVVFVVLGMVWIAFDLRREEPAMTVRGASPVPEAPAAVPAPPGKLHPDLEAGLAAMTAGRFDEARDRLTRVPRTDPGYTLALYNLARLEDRQGKLEAAERTYRELIAVQPGNANVWIGLGEVQYRAGRYDEAELSALRALEVAPTNATARYDIALFRVAAGKIDEAVRAYSRAFAVDAAGAQRAQGSCTRSPSSRISGETGPRKPTCWSVT